MEVFRFRELLGPSQVNGDVDQDWALLESTCGYVLPGDYKQFVSAYGPGCVNDQLYLFHPRAARGDDGLNLEDLWERVARAHDALRRNHPDMYPYEVYPAKGGYLPIGRSISGNHVFLAEPAPGSKDWRVAVDVGQLVDLELGFTDFLWQALREELFVPVVEGEPSFERIGVIEPY